MIIVAYVYSNDIHGISSNVLLTVGQQRTTAAGEQFSGYYSGSVFGVQCWTRVPSNTHCNVNGGGKKMNIKNKQIYLYIYI